jgi:hypothetical protein
MLRDRVMERWALCRRYGGIGRSLHVCNSNKNAFEVVVESPRRVISLFGQRDLLVACDSMNTWFQ